mgnify:CR=1 FL=1
MARPPARKVEGPGGGRGGGGGAGGEGRGGAALAPGPRQVAERRAQHEGPEPGERPAARAWVSAVAPHDDPGWLGDVGHLGDAKLAVAGDLHHTARAQDEGPLRGVGLRPARHAVPADEEADLPPRAAVREPHQGLDEALVAKRRRVRFSQDPESYGLTAAVGAGLPRHEHAAELGPAGRQIEGRREDEAAVEVAVSSGRQRRFGPSEVEEGSGGAEGRRAEACEARVAGREGLDAREEQHVFSPAARGVAHAAAPQPLAAARVLAVDGAARVVVDAVVAGRRAARGIRPLEASARGVGGVDGEARVVALRGRVHVLRAGARVRPEHRAKVGSRSRASVARVVAASSKREASREREGRRSAPHEPLRSNAAVSLAVRSAQPSRRWMPSSPA